MCLRSTDRMARRGKLVVAGNGMVGQKLLELLAANGGTTEWDVTVVG